VGDVKTAGLTAAPEAVIYFPYRQVGAMSNAVDVILRSGLGPVTLAPGLRKAAARLDPQQPIGEMSTMDHRLTESASRPRLAAVLLGSFAALGLILATVGLYGVMSFLVRWRFREIGIRLALGARPSDVVRMILTHSFKVILGGVVVGACCSLWLNRLIQTLLYGVSSADPLTFVVATGFLCLVGLSASYLPAYEASGIDPVTTLRSE
jgi:ABC-type antimicrobial peptide transport system permease subunit